MTEKAGPQPHLDRYARIIESMLRQPAAFAPQTESAHAVQVERGIAWPLAIQDPSGSLALLAMDRLVTLTDEQTLEPMQVVDRQGHRRPAYQALLVYAWLHSYECLQTTLSTDHRTRWQKALQCWCGQLESDFVRLNFPPGAIPAALGSSASEAVWIAMALHTASRLWGNPLWDDLARRMFDRLLRSQQPGGTFLLAGAGDNPETHWYHELVILHAVGSFAAQSNHAALASAAARSAEFHQNETQPDHATSQPWGLPAFIQNPQTTPLADQILHAVTVQGVGGVACILLADALYGLRSLQ